MTNTNVRSRPAVNLIDFICKRRRVARITFSNHQPPVASVSRVVALPSSREESHPPIHFAFWNTSAMQLSFVFWKLNSKFWNPIRIASASRAPRSFPVYQHFSSSVLFTTIFHSSSLLCCGVRRCLRAAEGRLLHRPAQAVHVVGRVFCGDHLHLRPVLHRPRRLHHPLFRHGAGSLILNFIFESISI